MVTVRMGHPLYFPLASMIWNGTCKILRSGASEWCKCRSVQQSMLIATAEPPEGSAGFQCYVSIRETKMHANRFANWSFPKASQPWRTQLDDAFRFLAYAECLVISKGMSSDSTTQSQPPELHICNPECRSVRLCRSCQRLM